MLILQSPFACKLGIFIRQESISSNYNFVQEFKIKTKKKGMYVC